MKKKGDKVIVVKIDVFDLFFLLEIRECQMRIYQRHFRSCEIELSFGLF